MKQLCVLLSSMAFLLLLCQAAIALQLVATWQYAGTIVPTGFQYQRCTGAGCIPADIPGAQVDGQTLTYTDATVVSDTLYCVSIVVLNGVARSIPSAPVCGTNITVPTGVTNVTITFR